MWKNAGFAAALFVLLVGAGTGVKRADLYMSGERVRSFSDFQLVNNTVFLPLKDSARALGIEGFADDQSRVVYFRTNSGLVVVDTNQKKVAVGTDVSGLSHRPLWTGAEVYVPHQVYTEVLARVMGVPIRVAANTGEGQEVSHGQDSLRNPVDVIVIDPGHGGKDTGARGPGGLFEKDVTLKISKKLAARLVKAGFTVHLTRDRDEYIALSKRPAIAKKLGADLFVSIHANGFKRITSEGFETFFASIEATDQAAMDLAQWENQAGSEYEAPDDVMSDIEAILGDMAQTESLSESQLLAEMVQIEMARVMDSDNRGVKQAPFNVLMRSPMPAVLIEVGFITNPREAKAITDDATQDKIVSAISHAVADYRDRYGARLGLAPH